MQLQLSTAAKPLASAPRVTDLAGTWAEFLDRWSWDWFCTLTFRGDAVHPEAADKRFRVWTSKINRELYGPRWYKHGQSVRWVRALEVQRRGVIHYHALLGGAGVEELRRLTWMDEWDRLAGYARIEPPRDGGAVRGYCAKYVTKGGELDISAAPCQPAQVRGRWLRATYPLGGGEVPDCPAIVRPGASWEAQEPTAPPWPGRPGVASAASETA